MKTPLTKHFSLEELTFSETGQRLGIKNKVAQPEHLENLKNTAHGLERIRAVIGCPITINSGYRCQELNNLTPGSSPTSQHSKGQAADIRADGFGSPAKLARVIADNAELIQFDQLILEYPPNGWVHVSFAQAARRQVLTKLSGKPYQVGVLA